MQDYIVSARKYRPMSWSAVVGQDQLTTTLRAAIHTGRLAHAYLFCGPRGVGKTTSARIFARTINCLNPTPELEACGECESCRAFNEGRSFNIHELDAASNNSVDDIRQLTEQVQIPPQVGKYKVFIIDEVHMLSTAAFNAFLKTLEEPPAHVIFILATTEKHKILPTILSRCQVFDFSRMTVADTVSHLLHVAQSEGYTAEPEALAIIAQKADGGMRDALSIFDQVVGYSGGNITVEKVIENLGLLPTDCYFQMVDLLLDRKVSDAMVLLNSILSRGFEPGQFITGLATHLRSVMLSRDQQTLPLLQCSEQMRERYRQQALRCQERFIYRALKLCTGCEANYRTSHSKRLLVEVTLIQISGADDDPAGRRPANTLPYIFEVEVQGASASAAVEAPQQPTPAKSDISTESETLVEEGTAESSSTKVVSKVSIKAFSTHSVIQTQQPEIETVVPEPTVTEAPEPTPIVNEEEEPPKELPKTLDDNLLRVLWNSYASTLGKDDTALQKRMQNIQPVLVSPTLFEVVMANQMAASDMQTQSLRICAYFTEQLSGTPVQMNIRIDEVQGEEVLTRPQMIQELINENPSIGELKDYFQLELT